MEIETKTFIKKTELIFTTIEIEKQKGLFIKDRFIDKNEIFRYTWMQLAIMNIVVLAVTIFLISKN